MPLRARNLIRKMRGGAQAHLIECDDGGYYVVKFTNNPQHRRILINEWLACAFLRYLQIHVPETAVVELTPEFIADTPELYLSIGSRREPVSAGQHFGSKMAVHPERVAVYDFLPDKLLYKIENRADFLGTLVFDKWASNADSRQAVFFRAKAKKWTPLKGEMTTANASSRSPGGVEPLVSPDSPAPGAMAFAKYVDARPGHSAGRLLPKGTRSVPDQCETGSVAAGAGGMRATARLSTADLRSSSSMTR